MGKRTAAEANADDDHDWLPAFMAATATRNNTLASSARHQLLESPEPLVLRRSSVEPAGACHSRVRAALPKSLKLPLNADMTDHADDAWRHMESRGTATAFAGGNGDTRDGEEDEEDDDDGGTSGDRLAELKPRAPVMPPLVAPRPRRVVSHELIFAQSPRTVTSEPPSLHALARRLSFRPIGADRPDVEITSPPVRAMNPVVMDARFQNMQRLDLALDARAAPLQPFQRPHAQRRALPSAPARIPVAAPRPPWAM